MLNTNGYLYDFRRWGGNGGLKAKYSTRVTMLIGQVWVHVR